MICRPQLLSKQTPMRRRWWCLGAACTLMAVFLATAATAGEGMPKLATAQKWHVAPIEQTGSKPGERHFCSAKLRFTNDVTLVVGRDSDGGQTLAIEYTTDLFSAGATIPALLVVNGAAHDVNALAATRRVLLMGLPRGGAVESQLVVNTLMEVLVAKQRHIFTIGGYKAADAALDSCIAAGAIGDTFEVVKLDADAPKESFKSSPMITEHTIQRFSNVTPEEARSFNPAEAARAVVMQDEIDRLRRQNEELLMHRQAIENQILTGQEDGDVLASVPAAPVVQRSVKKINWPKAEGFEDMVATYLTTEAARCPADFAQTEGAAYTSGDRQVREIEIACLGTPDALGGSSRDYAAALLFVGSGGQIQVFMHQGPAGMIEQALQGRARAVAEMGLKN